jgi:DNA-binding SARP family transcriptional activator
VRLQLFGQPSLLTPNQHYALSGYSAYVLTWLVLHGKTAPLNARLRLARALWIDTDEDQARRRLVNTLYRLKRDVPELEPHLVGDASTIGLQDVACDALEFETQMRHAEPSQWLPALDLYSTDLLEGQDLPWLEEWRLQLRELYLSGLDRAIMHCETSQPQQAIVYALRLVAADNLSEDAHAHLIRLYAKQNRTAEALAQFQTLQDMLTSEFGSQPRRELVAFIASLRVDTKTDTKMLVGRQREVQGFGALLKSLQAGVGGMVFLEGNPGMGKTRLIEEFIQLTQWHQIVVLHASTQEQNARTYAPLDQAIQSAGWLLEYATPLMRETMRPLLEPNTNPIASTSGAVGAALERWLSKLEEPLVLFLDDIQWSGDLFWTLLPVLARATQKRLVLVLSYRSHIQTYRSEAVEILGNLRQQFPVQHLLLQGLSIQECNVLSSRIGQKLSPPELERVFRLTEGNPLSFQEMVNSNQSDTQIEDVLNMRIKKLNQQQREALEAASVLGTQFSLTDWEQILMYRPPFAELIKARFIQFIDYNFVFQHDLIRVFIYQQIPENERKKWHSTIFEHLKENAQDMVLIHHAQAAGETDKIVPYLIRASEIAMHLGSNTEAKKLLDKVLEILSPTPQIGYTQIHAKILQLQLVEKDQILNEHLGQLEMLEKSCLENNFEDLLYLVWNTQLNGYGALGQKDTFFKKAEKVIEYVEKSSFIKKKIEVFHAIAFMAANNFNQPDFALPLAQKAAFWAEDESIASFPETKFETLCSLVFVYLRKNMLEESKKDVQELKNLIRLQPKLELLKYRVLFFEHFIATLELRHEDALNLRLEELEAHRTTGNNFGINATLLNLINTLGHLGQYQTALVWAEELFERNKNKKLEMNILATHLSRIAYLQARISQPELAKKTLAPILEWLDTAQGAGAINTWEAIGWVEFQKQAYEKAYHAFIKAIELRSNPKLSLKWNIMACQAAHFAGLRELALSQYQQFTQHSSLQNPDTALNLLYLRFLMEQNPKDLDLARQNLLGYAARIQNREFRQSVLEATGIHQSVNYFWSQQQLVVTNVTLSRPDGIGTREITWTLDSGASDASILAEQGKVALRRHRLQRLALEAAVQDAAPTQNDLAEALGVTLRTIEMDLAALRKDGIELRTLGTLQSK